MYKKSKNFDSFLGLLVDIGFFKIVVSNSKNFLTVLNYHRINDIEKEPYYSYQPNISATPGDFELQMQHIKKNYQPITSEHLVAWLHGKSELPERAALITFDDGYHDNLVNAFPILNSLNIPAVIFLATDFIGSKKTFYWDFVAFLFGKTRIKSVDLPLIGNVKWSSGKEREVVMRKWITEIKKLSDVQKQKYIEQLPGLLEVSSFDDAFTELYLNWDQVRYLSQHGIEFGSHTASHPILTRIDLKRVKSELLKSKSCIEDEVGKPVIAFAYPNGQKSDFSHEVINQIQEADIKVAFSLLPGPTRYSTVRKNPFEIRRVYIGNNDTFPRFVAKLSGLSRIVE